MLTSRVYFRSVFRDFGPENSGFGILVYYSGLVGFEKPDSGHLWSRLQCSSLHEFCIANKSWRWSTCLTNECATLAVSQTVELEATLAGSYPELLPGMSGTAVFPPR